jgi:membrane associated rhomboid family serine protease
VIPIKDDNPTSRVPFVTIALILANVAVFVYEFTLPANGLRVLVETWGLVPAHVSLGLGGLSWVPTVFSSMFLHGGWLHLIGNMLYLWIFGNNIEDRLGAVGFLAFYLAAGVIAAATEVFVSPGSSVPVIGASGAISGVLGAYVVLFPRARVLTVIPIFFVFEMAAVPAGFVIGFWFLLQVASGVGSLGAGGTAGGVAWFAHIGGFLAGALAILPFALSDRRRANEGRFTSW